MDSGVANTQKIVIAVAIIIGFLILVIIGYSLYRKAGIAEEELAKKVALDNVTKKTGDRTAISLTGESKNTSQFTYDNLTQKNNNDSTSTEKMQVVNETITVVASDTLPVQEDIQTPANEDPTPIVTTPPQTKPIVKPTSVPKTTYRPVYQPVDSDLPLTAAQIRAIRSLPIDSSPSGVLQTQLEAQSGGEYKAQY